MSAPVKICIYDNKGRVLGNCVISQQSHAALAYDAPDMLFLLGHAQPDEMINVTDPDNPRFKKITPQ